MASFLPRPSCHRGKSWRYSLNWRLGGPRKPSGHFGEERNLLHLPYIAYLVNFFSFSLLRPLLFQSSIFCLIRCRSFTFQCFLCYLSFLFLTFVPERGVMYVIETQLHGVINQQVCLHASRHASHCRPAVHRSVLLIICLSFVPWTDSECLHCLGRHEKIVLAVKWPHTMKILVTLITIIYFTIS